MQAQLLAPLEIGAEYRLEFYASSSEFQQFFTSGLQMALTVDSLKSYVPRYESLLFAKPHLLSPVIQVL